MRRIFLVFLSAIMLLQAAPSVFAFTDTKPSPFINKTYTHDDKFLNYEIINGIDVSQWQATVDFAKAKAAGADFVFLRAAYRGYSNGSLKEDTTFDKYATDAIAAGFDVGAYIYSQAITKKEARQEADFIMDIVADYDITLPIVFDFEYAPTSDSRLVAANLTPRQQTDICLAFCQRVEKAGYTACVYANQSMLTNDLYDEEIAEKYDIWLANYSIKPSLGGKLYESDYLFWQYTSVGSVDGISGNVDCNFRYYKKPSKVADLKIIDETFTQTNLSWSKIKGCYGYQVYKLNKLTGKYQKVATLKGANITSYADTQSMGTANSYKVRAMAAYKGAFKTGSFSDVASSQGIFQLKLDDFGTTYSTFSWETPQNTTGFTVIRSYGEEGDEVEIATLGKDKTSYTDTTANAFKTCYYSVKANINNSDNSLNTSIVTPVLTVGKIQPTIQSAVLSTNRAIKVSWNAVEGAHGTEIYRQAPGEDYKLVKTINNNTTNAFINKKLTRGIKYTYKIRQFVVVDDVKYYSEFTQTKSATTLKAPVVTLQAGKKRIKVSYDSVLGKSGYEIYLKPYGGRYSLVKSTTKNYYTRKYLLSGKKYYIRVRAYKNVNGVRIYSPYSKTRAIRPL